MEIAALILAALAFVIASADLIWNLAKHFSTHTVQLQPVESLFNPQPSKTIGEDFEEFDSVPAVPMTEEERKEILKRVK